MRRPLDTPLDALDWGRRSTGPPLDALPANITVTGGGGTSTLEVNGSGSTDNLYEMDKGVISAYLRKRSEISFFRQCQNGRDFFPDVDQPHAREA